MMDVQEALKLLAQSTRHRRGWRQSAREDFQYVAGHQWSVDDETRMDRELRPHVTFNTISPIVDAIVGHEVSNRQDITFIPRQPGQAAVNEVLSAAAEWIRDECDAEQEETEAFYDCTVCGEGWTDTEVSYEQDPDGRIEVLRVDPLQMDVDSLATRKNYADARWLCHTKIYDRSEALERWPDGQFEGPQTVTRSTDTPVDVIAAAFYKSDSGAEGRDASLTSQVLIHDFQWYELEKFYRIPARLIAPEQALVLLHGQMSDLAKQKPGEEPLVSPDDLKPDSNGLISFSAEKWAKVKDILKNIPPLVQKRRCYYRMYFSGPEELESRSTPAADSFSYKAITAKRDHKGQCWYGVVRAMKDPQKWVNKFMSSSLEQLATSAKGGIMYETGAFVDPRAAEQDWANPSRNIEMNAGYLQKGGVQPRPVNAVPPQMAQLMTFTQAQINSTAGVNPEVMGLSQALDPSGTMEEGRRQAGLDMLSYLFDSLRQYRREQGRLLLTMIKKFIPPGRLVRITGPQGTQFVPLAYDQGTTEFDVVVDEAPTAPNVKQRTWEGLMELARTVPALLNPQMAMIALDYAPFPQAMIAQIKQQAQKSQAQPNPQEQLAQVKAQEIAASAELKRAQAQHEMQAGQVDAMQAASATQADQIKAQAEVAAARAKVQQAMIDNSKSAMKAQAEVAASRAKADQAISGAHVGRHKVTQESHKTLQSHINTLRNLSGNGEVK